MAKLKFTNAIAEDLKTAASDSFIDSLKMIEIEDIQPNEDNFYEMSEIDELAEDIERQGLMIVLIVETAENGKYQLISGHRRLTAIKRLVDEGRYKSTTVPCYVKTAKSHEETQLDLIMMNATQRKYSDADTMREYEELERIFKALDEAGKPVKGKMRDNIAKVLNVSPAQVAKIDNIKHNAIPDIEQAVKSGEMSISTANEVAKLAPEQQRDIIENKPDISHKEVKEIQKKSPPKPKKEKSSPPPASEVDEIADEIEDTEEEITGGDVPDNDDVEIVSESYEPLLLSDSEAAALARYTTQLLEIASDNDFEVINGLAEKLRRRSTI